MALSAATILEVRTTGSDTNGGGFVAGASGTDWSQQDAAQYSVTDGVTAGTTTIISATANFGTDVVGNIMYVAGGTGSVVGAWYQITARTNSTTITVDRSTGLTAGTGATLIIGGALATIGAAGSIVVGSNKIWVKSGTYTITATIALAAAGVSPSNTVMATRISGYKTTRGDIALTSTGTYSNNSSRPLINLSTNTGITGLSATNGGWFIDNFVVDCNSLTTANGIVAAGAFSTVRNCKVQEFTIRGINMSSGGGDCAVYDNEVTAGASGATCGINLAGITTTCENNNVHDNICPGIISVRGTSVIRNLVTGNTGASSDGIQCQYSTAVLHNVCWGNGRHGISNTLSNLMIAPLWRGNLLVNNGGYGIQGASASGNPADCATDRNFFYNNTSGLRNNMDDTSGINASGAYARTDVTLAGDPFTNAAGGDFSLNNTAGAGAAVRAAALPGVFPGGTTTGYLDGGTAQHQDSGSTTTYVVTQHITQHTEEINYY